MDSGAGEQRRLHQPQRSVSVTGALSTLSPHGLLGQTHTARRYTGRVCEMQGGVDDYVMAEDDVFERAFLFNQLGGTTSGSR